MWSTIHQAIRWHAQQTPDHPAIVGSGGACSYAELWQHLNRWAEFIAQTCNKPDGPVLIRLQPGPRQLAALLGTMAAGRVAIPIDVDDGPARVSQLAGMLNIALAIVNPDDSAVMEALSIRCITGQPETTANPGSFSVDTTLDASRPCRLLFTSGTTGQPQGYLHSHRQLLAYAGFLDASLPEPVARQDRIATLFSPAYAASSLFYIASLAAGATLYPYDIRDGSAADLAQWLQREKITVLGLTPGLLRAMFSGRGATDCFPDLRCIVLTGDRVWPDDIRLGQQSMGSAGAVAVQYGATQIGPMACLCYQGGQTVEEPMPVGKPLPNVVVEIVDGNGQVLPGGTTGRIQVGRYDGLPRQYKNPGSLDQPIAPDPNGTMRIATGDQGRIREDGQVEISGRVGNRVKVRGFPVDLSEVEQALLTIDEVSQAVVMLERDTNAPRLVAHLGGQTNAPTDREIRQQLQTKLPRHAIPTFFVWWRHLPTTGRGKVDRSALAAVPLQTTLHPVENAAQTPTERQLERIWADVLEQTSVDIDDRFLEIGGDSLRAYVLAELVRDQFHIDIAPASLLKASTIREQAGMLDRRTDSSGQGLVMFRPTGHRTPIVFLHGVGGGALYAAPFLDLVPDRPAYGLQADSVSALSGLNNMGTLADHYLAMLPIAHDAPVVLVGYSFGGMLAWEIACRLREQHRPVAMVIIIDTTLDGAPRAIPRDRHLRRFLFRVSRGVHLGRCLLAARLRASHQRYPGKPQGMHKPAVREPIVQHLSQPGFSGWQPPPGDFPVTIVGAAATVNRADHVWRAAGQQTVDSVNIPGCSHEDIVTTFGPTLFRRINRLLAARGI